MAVVEQVAVDARNRRHVHTSASFDGDASSRRRRADRLRTRSPWPSKHRVEPRLRARVGSAAKQGDKQARAIARDRTARVSSIGSFLLIREVHPYVLFPPFSGSSPRLQCLRLAAAPVSFFGAEFPVTAAHAAHRNDGKVDGRNFTLVFNSALRGLRLLVFPGFPPRVSLARRGPKGLSAISLQGSPA